MPAEHSISEIYGPLEHPEEIVLDAVRAGRIYMSKDAEAETRKAIFEFIRKFGLLDMMTALPTAPNFIEYEKVYLPKESLSQGRDDRRGGLSGTLPSLLNTPASKEGHRIELEAGERTSAANNASMSSRGKHSGTWIDSITGNKPFPARYLLGSIPKIVHVSDPHELIRALELFGHAPLPRLLLGE